MILQKLKNNVNLTFRLYVSVTSIANIISIPKTSKNKKSQIRG